MRWRWKKEIVAEFNWNRARDDVKEIDGCEGATFFSKREREEEMLRTGKGGLAWLVWVSFFPEQRIRNEERWDGRKFLVPRERTKIEEELLCCVSGRGKEIVWKAIEGCDSKVRTQEWKKSEHSGSVRSQFYCKGSSRYLSIRCP